MNNDLIFYWPIKVINLSVLQNGEQWSMGSFILPVTCSIKALTRLAELVTFVGE